MGYQPRISGCPWRIQVSRNTIPMAIRPPFSWAYLVRLSSHWHGAVMSLPDEQIRQRVVKFSQARIANAGQATKQPDIKPRRHRRTPAVAPGRRLAVQDCRQPQGRKLLQITAAEYLARFTGQFDAAQRATAER